VKKTIMVVGAHADDVEILAGGTLARYIADGYKGYYVLVTNSNSGYCPGLKKGAGLDFSERFDFSEKMVKIRRQEAVEASKIFGAEMKELDFKEHNYTQENGQMIYVDIHPFPELEGKKISGREPIVSACAMDKYIREFAEIICAAEPEIIITHTPDGCPTHYASALLTYRAFQAASRNTKLGGLYIRTTFEISRLGLLNLGIQPDFFVDVSDYTSIAEKAINKHVSQGGNIDWVPVLRKAWECYANHIAGARYVEAFRKLL